MDRPILAIHSASSYTLLTPDDSLPPHHVQIPTQTALSDEVIATQIMSTNAEFTNGLVVDASGHWVSFTLEGQSGSVKASLAKEGTLVKGKRVFSSASISKDGVITAIGQSLATSLRMMTCLGSSHLYRYPKPAGLAEYQRGSSDCTTHIDPTDNAVTIALSALIRQASDHPAGPISSTDYPPCCPLCVVSGAIDQHGRYHYHLQHIHHTSRPARPDGTQRACRWCGTASRR